MKAKHIHIVARGFADRLGPVLTFYICMYCALMQQNGFSLLGVWRVFKKNCLRMLLCSHPGDWGVPMADHDGQDFKLSWILETIFHLV